jgi:hypothetical protein
LLAFRFDSDRGAAAIAATLGAFEPGPAGSPATLELASLAPDAGPTPAADFYTVTPCRLLDTRTPAGGPAITAGSTRELNVPAVGACGVPTEASAVALNVTVVGAPSGGELAVFSATPGITATVAFAAGAVRANNAIAMVTLDGRLRLRPSLGAPGAVHVVVDVVGYFVPAP